MEPAILPTDWRDAHAVAPELKQTGLWCGILLGSCGEQLTAKTGAIRIPHFSHLPDPTGEAFCTRRSGSRRSADHLFVNRDLTNWFAHRGVQLQKPEFHGDMGTETGCSGIDLRLGGATGLIVVALTDGHTWSWRTRDTELRQQHQWVTWMFGPGVTIPFDLFERDGYGLRVRCEDDGASRVMRIGTQVLHSTTEWADLDDCELTDTGPITRRASKLRPGRSPSGPADGHAPADGAVTNRAKLLGNVLTLLDAANAACKAHHAASAWSPYKKAAQLAVRAGVTDARLEARMRACKARVEALMTTSPQPVAATPSSRVRQARQEEGALPGPDTHVAVAPERETKRAAPPIAPYESRGPRHHRRPRCRAPTGRSAAQRRATNLAIPR